MTSDAVVYVDVDRNTSRWFWTLPSDDPSRIPQVHGPFRSEAAARRDVRMFVKRRVPVPEDTVKFAYGILASLAADWLRSSAYYEQQEPTAENKSRAAMAKNNHAEVRKHLDALDVALTGGK